MGHAGRAWYRPCPQGELGSDTTRGSGADKNSVAGDTSPTSIVISFACRDAAHCEPPLLLWAAAKASHAQSGPFRMKVGALWSHFASQNSLLCGLHVSRGARGEVEVCPHGCSQWLHSLCCLNRAACWICFPGVMVCVWMGHTGAGVPLVGTPSCCLVLVSSRVRFDGRLHESMLVFSCQWD